MKTALALITFLFVVESAQATLCRKVLASDVSTTREKVEESFSQMIRSQPQKFFSFLKKFQSSHPKLTPFLQQEGWISGDSHPGQWTFVPNEGKFVYTLADFDMAGKGPLILDFLQYALNIKAIIHQSPETKDQNIRIKKMLEAYLNGLQGTEMKAPKWARKILEKDEKSFLKKEQKYYLKKLDGHGKLKVEEGFVRIKEASLRADIFAALEGTTYFRNYEIRDIVKKEIERGGSAGQQRYWILVREKSDQSIYRIFELKQKQAGVLPGSEYATEAMYQVFWGEKHPGYFDVSLRDESFEVRPKKVALDEADVPYKLKSEEAWEYLEEKAIYDLYLLGRAQSTQKSAPKLTDLVWERFDEITDLTKDFIKSYIEAMAR